MFRDLFITLLLTLLGLTSFAQSIIGASGQSHFVNQHEYTFTIGEVLVDYADSAAIILSQGYHQPILNTSGCSPTTFSTQNVSFCDSTIINGKMYASSQTISDTLTGALGCHSIVTINLTINKSPDISLANQILCQGQTATFDAGSSFSSYLWSSNGFGTDQTTTGSAAGTYTVEVTDENGCKDTSSATLILEVVDSIVSYSGDTSCTTGSLSLIAYTLSGDSVAWFNNDWGAEIIGKSASGEVWKTPFLDSSRMFFAEPLKAYDNLYKEGNGVTDFEGNHYTTTILNNGQEWMAENLRSTKYSNGDSIPNVINNNEWDNLSTGAYCWYNNDSTFENTYGKLYNWHAVSDSRNVCPENWHVASRMEWINLREYLESTIPDFYVQGMALKATDGWDDIDGRSGNGIDTVGFNALPGGLRYHNYHGVGTEGYWWSSYSESPNYATFERMDRGSGFGGGSYGYEAGMSIRCVTDNYCLKSTKRVFVMGFINLPEKVSISNQSICEGDTATFDAGTGYSSYSWSSGDLSTNQIITGTTAGTYTVEVTDGNGCKDTASSILTIISPSTSTQNIFSCGAKVVKGVTYTSSQILVDTLVGASSTGCDSVVTTNLTITNSETSTINLTSCVSALINGEVYTSSQVITDTLTGALGCDSIVITNLTINGAGTSTQDLSFCDNAIINGKNYTSSQTIIDTLSGASIYGCDSVVTTNLTIKSGTNANSLIKGVISHQENPVEGGVVQLIRKEGNTPQSIFDIDSAIIANDGSFRFQNVPNGDYLLKAKVDNALYPNTLSTYNGFTNHWQKASVVSIACLDSITDINLNMINFSETLGSSSIIGNINTLSLANALLNEIEISLEKMPEGILVSGTTIDSNGDFIFENIELGEYRVIVDAIGFNMDTNSILNIINSMIKLDMTLCVNEKDAVIQVCQALGSEYTKNSKNTEFKVFPNPVYSTVNFEAIHPSEIYSITIINSTGQKIYREENISNKLSIELNGYAKGVYYFSISGENGFQIGNFIKK